MCDTIRYLDLRSRGHTKIPQFRKSLKSVKQLLENHATRPSINQPCEFSGEPRATFLVDFSRNKRWAASTHGDHTVRVTDVLTGKCTHILTGHPRTPWCLAFNPASDDILASGCLGGEVRIWDLRGRGSEVLQNPSKGQVITSLAFSPSGDAVVFATLNKIYFWAWTRSKPFALTQTKYEFERVRWLRFDPFGRYLYTGIANNSSGRRTTAEREPAHSLNTSERLDPRMENETAVNRRRYEVLRRIVNRQYAHGHPVPNASQSFLDMSRPRSPVNEDRLESARQYARQVTALTSGPGSVPSVPGRTAARSLYSSSRAGTLDTALASSMRPRYQGSRPRILGTDRELTQPPSSSGSTPHSSVPPYDFGQERRSRWGRYRPAFFSRSSDDRSHENSDGPFFSNDSNRNNTSSEEEDDDVNNRDSAVPESIGQFLQEIETRRYNGQVQEGEVSDPPPLPLPTFHPFSVRREVSLGDGLETDEFEILPVDQGGGTESLLPDSNSSISTAQEGNRRSNSGAAGRGSDLPEPDINLRWNDFRSLWMRCSNNSEDETGASSSNRPSSSQDEFNVSASRESSEMQTRATALLRPMDMRRERNSTRPRSVRFLLNSDPFMGYAEQNVEFSNMLSRQSSSNSTIASQSLTNVNQNAPSWESEGNRASSSREERNSSQHQSQEHAFQGRFLEPAEVNLGDGETSDESVQQNTVDQGSEAEVTRHHGNPNVPASSQQQTPSNSFPIRTPSGVLCQNGNTTYPSVSAKNDQLLQQKEESGSLNGSTHCEHRVTSRDNASSRKDNVEGGRCPVNADIKDGLEQDPVPKNISCNDRSINEEVPAQFTVQNHGETLTPAGPSGCRTGTKRKLHNDMESSGVSQDSRGGKIRRPQRNENPESDEIGGILRVTSETCETNTTTSSTDSLSHAHTSGLLINNSADLLTVSGQLSLTEHTDSALSVSDNQRPTSPSRISIDFEAPSSTLSSVSPAVTSFYLPCYAVCPPGIGSTTAQSRGQRESTSTVSVTVNNPQLLTSFSNSNSAVPDLASEPDRTESTQESTESVAVTSSDVTAVLTQALAAVHCSRPAVSSSAHHSVQGNNPFCSIESPALVSVTLSTSTSTSTSGFSTAVSSSTVPASSLAQSHRGTTLRTLYDSNLPSAFTAFSTSGQLDVASPSAAHRTSTAVFSHVSLPSLLSSSQFNGAYTVPSPSHSVDPNQSSTYQTAETSTNERHPLLYSLFGRRRQQTDGAHASSQPSRLTTEDGATQRAESLVQTMGHFGGETTQRSSDSLATENDITQRAEHLLQSLRRFGGQTTSERSSDLRSIENDIAQRTEQFFGAMTRFDEETASGRRPASYFPFIMPVEEIFARGLPQSSRLTTGGDSTQRDVGGGTTTEGHLDSSFRQLVMPVEERFSLASRVATEGDSTQRAQQLSQTLRGVGGGTTTEGHLDSSSHQLDIPLVERLESLSRSVGERLQNLSRTVGRRASQLSQLQHRISVLEETYNRRMRVLHREYTHRQNLSNLRRRLQESRSRFLRREFLNRHGALLGHNRTQSTVSEVQSSIAAELRHDQAQRAAFADSLGLRARRGGIMARSRQNALTRGRLNLGPLLSESRTQEHRLSPPLLNPVEPDLPQTSATRTRPFGLPRTGIIPSVPHEPAPGSLHLFGEDDREHSEDELDEGGRISPSYMPSGQHEGNAEFLHPDYQHSILRDGFNRHDDPLHYMVNSTIAGGL
ncbi:activating molecule in BECN1-regulated autophagy protein 1 [Elysia marginata]|uniref:Activating molecule in BECN1-regulated autophagy protein 1 n=1 Tax=Elysia marginata TaxID=1093978 RepID=A0AAV4IHE5_9GAST|nr:activating molecule in BECN1-regulated autophagy protein 1 [Elysia marginata]